MNTPNLLDLPEYRLIQKTRLVEMRGEYAVVQPSGTVGGYIREREARRADKAFRGLLGFAGRWERSFDVTTLDGTHLCTVIATDGTEEVRVLDADGALEGAVTLSLLKTLLPFPAAHPVRDASGTLVGHLRTHGLRRRRFSLELGGQVVAQARQPWAGLLRERFTQADRFEYTRTAPAPAGARALVFALPLVVDIAFKGFGSPAPAGVAADLLF